MHEAEIRVRLGDGGGEVRVASQRGDVVDHHSAERERLPRDDGARRVDGHRLAGEQLEHR